MDDQKIGSEQAAGIQPVDGAGFVDVDAGGRLERAGEGKLLFEPRRADRIDAEADVGQGVGIVEPVVDQAAIGEGAAGSSL